MSVEKKTNIYKSPEGYVSLLSQIDFSKSGRSIGDISEIELELGTGEIVKGLRFGSEDGEDEKNIVYMMPPASFYFREFPEFLKRDFVIYAFDADPKVPFVIEEGQQIDETIIRSITWDKISKRSEEIATALFHKHNKKIILGGVSAPGTLPFKLAVDIKKDIISGVLGIVPAFKKTGRNFSTANAYFLANARPARLARDEAANANKNEILEKVPLNVRNKPSFNFKFFGVALFASRQLGSNLDKDPKCVQKLVDFWDSNSIGQIANGMMQEHFFNSIFSELDPPTIYAEFNQKNIPGKIIIAEKDNITPAFSDELDKVKKFENIEIVTIPKAGHFLWTHNEEVAEQIINFGF